MQKRNVVLLIAGAVTVLIVITNYLTRTDGSREVAAVQTSVHSNDSESETSSRRGSLRSVRTASSAAGVQSNSQDEPGESAPARQARVARADDAMSPDNYQPNPLKQIGADLREHPADLEAMMEQLKNETDVEKIKMLAQLIAENAEAAGVDLPIKDLLEMAGSGNPIKRMAALRILSTSSRVTPEMIQTVAELSKTDAQKDVRFAAINTMGEWMDRNANLREQLSSEIIGARDASPVPEVRGFAIQTVGLQKNGVSESMLAPIVQSMRSEKVPEIRSLAALAVSNVEPHLRPQALASLQEAYQAEQDLDARRHLLTMIMRTGGNAAPEILQRLPANDPLLRQDIADYVSIMASGVTDVNQIYDQKNQLDGQRGTETDTDINCGVVAASR